MSLAAVAVVALVGCGEPSSVTSQRAGVGPNPAEKFLRWSMDKYSAFPAYKADVDVVAQGGQGVDGASQKRTLIYESPNRFRIISKGDSGAVQTVISDGRSMIEYASYEKVARTYDAPASIFSATSMKIKHPMFCGSLLYQFFGGSRNFDGLVQASKAPISFGKDETTNGENCHLVKFYGQDLYGNVEALIGEDSGRVYRIQYDSEPLKKMNLDPDALSKMQASMSEDVDKMEPGAEREATRALIDKMGKDTDKLPGETIETYSNIEVPKNLVAADFDAKPPENKDSIAMFEPDSRDLPIVVGEPAPDFEVRSMDGRTVKLSSLQGHIVLLDFWATWCSQCKESLEEMQNLTKMGHALGLEVLAISDEDSDLVAKFLKENGYSVPAYTDPNGLAVKAYAASALPTTVIIDSRGNVSSYLSGLHDAKEIEEALATVGLNRP